MSDKVEKVLESVLMDGEDDFYEFIEFNDISKEISEKFNNEYVLTKL